MSKDLLKPRFKLIADYPGNTQPIGNITIEDATASYFRRFSANFKELQWWQERDESELPKYLKEIETGEIFKATRYFIDGRIGVYYTGEVEKTGKWKGGETPFNLWAMMPATEAEYLSTHAQLETPKGSS